MISPERAFRYFLKNNRQYSHAGGSSVAMRQQQQQQDIQMLSLYLSTVFL